MDIVFVILNYNIYKETVDCVESIRRNLDTRLFHIIIVDNASPDGIGNALKDLYKSDSLVTVLQNQENEGFARGNNHGIQEAKKLNPKFICCLNNDTLLEQKNFFENLEKEYNKDFPAVIGPKVILKDGRIQHVNKELLSIDHYKTRIENLEKGIPIYGSFKENLLKNRILYELNFLRPKYRKEKQSEFSDVILHGCCLIFTPVFFEKLNGFDDRTFLYVEEQLLYVALKKNGLHNKYCPNIQIRHLEDISTKSVARSNKAKAEWVRKNTVDSLRILVQELESHQQVIYQT